MSAPTTTAQGLLDAFRAAPFVKLDALTGGRPVLVLAPHPDDESLAWGGLIASCCASGIDVHVAVLTDGTGSHPNSPTWPPARLKMLREREAREAVAALGLPPERICFFDQPDSRAPHDGADFVAIGERIARYARALGVCTICTTWRHDPHCDHEAAAKLAAWVARRIAARALETPVWGWTLAADHRVPGAVPPVWRLDIAPHLARKRAAIAAHRSQVTTMIGDSPHGFQLPAAFLAEFDHPWEVFVQA